MTPEQRQAHMLREAADACEDHANCELIYAETCKPSKVKGAKDRAVQLCGLTGELRAWADQLDPHQSGGSAPNTGDKP